MVVVLGFLGGLQCFCCSSNSFLKSFLEELLFAGGYVLRCLLPEGLSCFCELRYCCVRTTIVGEECGRGGSKEKKREGRRSIQGFYDGEDTMQAVVWPQT